MLSQTDIAEHAERHVEQWLKARGYRCHCSKPDHGACDIEARGPEENLFVHVMAARGEREVPELTSGDRAKVVSRAMTLGFDAWLAQVHVDPHGELLGEIVWTQLNH